MGNVYWWSLSGPRKRLREELQAYSFGWRMIPWMLLGRPLLLNSGGIPARFSRSLTGQSCYWASIINVILKSYESETVGESP